MVSDGDMLEEIDARLAAVADVQFALVQKIGGEIEAASDAKSLAVLSEPLERCARSIRLTYALRVKLRKDVRKLERDEAKAEDQALSDRIRGRKAWIRSGVEGFLGREFEREDEEESDELDDLLNGLIETEALSPAFLTEELGDQVQRLLARLGYEFTPDGLVRKARPPPAHHSSA